MNHPQPFQDKVPRPASGGYSLLEVVVALAILGISLAGIYKVMTVSMQTRQVALNHYVATVMANNQIERAKNLAFGNLSLLAEDELRVDELGTTDANGRYLRSTTIEPVWGGESNLTRITVTILPPAPNQRSAAGNDPVSVSTLIKKPYQP